MSNFKQSDDDNDGQGSLREWQDAIREHVIKLSGCPDELIDGSEYGALEFTLSEITQGFDYVEEKHKQLDDLVSLKDVIDILTELRDKNHYSPTSAMFVCSQAILKLKALGERGAKG